MRIIPLLVFLVLTIILNSCSIFRYSPLAKTYNVTEITINIIVDGIDATRSNNIDEIINDPLEEFIHSSSCINLPHCPTFDSHYNKENQLYKLVSSTKTSERLWKMGSKCETIVIINYRGYGNFSNGGSDTKTFFLKPQDELKVVEALNKDKLLYTISHDNKTTFSLKNAVKQQDKILAEYTIENNKSKILQINELHTIKKYRAVKIIGDRKAWICM